MPVRKDILAVQGGYKIYILNTGRDLTTAVAVRIGYKWKNAFGVFVAGYWTEANGVERFQTTKVKYKHTDLPSGEIAIWPEADFGNGFEVISPDPLIYWARAKGRIP